MPVKAYAMPKRPEGMPYVKLPSECYDALESIHTRRRCESLLFYWTEYFITGVLDEDVPATIAATYRGALANIDRVRSGILTGGIRHVVDQSPVADLSSTGHRQVIDQSSTSKETSGITSQTNLDYYAGDLRDDPATYPETFPQTFPEFEYEPEFGIENIESIMPVKSPSKPELTAEERDHLRELTSKLVFLGHRKKEAKRELWAGFKSGGMLGAKAKFEELAAESQLADQDFEF